MKSLVKKSLYVAAFICSTSLASQVMAQNVASVSTGVTVNNSITASLANTGLNFGVVAMIPGTEVDNTTANVMSATASVDASGVLSAAAGDTGTLDGTDIASIASVVDNTNAQAALVNISDVVDAATINITINNVTAPQAGFNTLGLDSFVTRFNGGTETALAALSGGSTSTTATFSSSYGSGTNTLAIGATISAAEGATINQTTPYTGSFDVVLDY